jgi:hypothetical protein
MSKERKEQKFTKSDKVTVPDKETGFMKGKSANNSKGKFTPRRNPWDLYATDEATAKDIASIPFNYISGLPFNYNGLPTNTTGTNAQVKKFALNQLPGVMVISYVPTPGGASMDGTSSINMAARQLYSYIRRNNSGAKNYEAPDLMLFVLAMEDIYNNFFELKRAYGLAQNYQFANRFTPKALVEGIGIDFEDLTQNLAGYRYKINLLARKINSLAVPKYFKSFIRRVVLSSQVFSDSTSARSGYYIYAKQGYYQFKFAKYETGGALEYVPTFRSEQHTLQWYIDIIEQQITTILTDDDMNVMMGDILKAFGEGGVYSVTEIDDNYTVVPVYDENVLAQIENSRSFTLYGGEMDYAGVHHSGLDVFQKDNVLYWTPCYDNNSTEAISRGFALIAPIINSHKDNPDYKDVLEWSRQMTCPSGQVVENLKFVSCGLEIVTGYAMIAYTPENETFALPFTSFTMVTNFQTGNVDVATAFNVALAISQFDWHPFLYVFDGDTSGPEIFGNIQGFAGDLKVFTTIESAILTRIHDCANYSVYYDKLS